MKLRGKDDEGTLGGNRPEGEVVVGGPAVAAKDGWVGLGVRGRFREDGTLALV